MSGSFFNYCFSLILLSWSPSLSLSLAVSPLHLSLAVSPFSLSPLCLSSPSISISQDDVKEYAGPTPGDLLDPLFKQSSCSYRVRTAQFHFYFCLNISYLEYHCNTSNTNVMGLTPLGSVARYTGTMVISRYQKVMILMIPTF